MWPSPRPVLIPGGEQPAYPRPFVNMPGPPPSQPLVPHGGAFQGPGGGSAEVSPAWHPSWVLSTSVWELAAMVGVGTWSGSASRGGVGVCSQRQQPGRSLALPHTGSQGHICSLLETKVHTSCPRDSGPYSELLPHVGPGSRTGQQEAGCWHPDRCQPMALPVNGLWGP